MRIVPFLIALLLVAQTTKASNPSEIKCFLQSVAGGYKFTALAPLRFQERPLGQAFFVRWKLKKGLTRDRLSIPSESETFFCSIFVEEADLKTAELELVYEKNTKMDKPVTLTVSLGHLRK
jgi:hypothetical protein